MVRDSLQVGRNEVGAVAQIVVEIDWHLVETHHIALDVAQFGLFAEQEPRGRHAMLKRESLHGDGIVLIYYGLLAANDVEFNLIAAIGEEEIEKLAEHLSTLGIDVNGERAGALVQVESSEQPRQPEAVVAVQVAYENMVESLHLQVLTSKAKLGRFATINHKQIVANVKHLARRHVPERCSG